MHPPSQRRLISRFAIGVTALATSAIAYFFYQGARRSLLETIQQQALGEIAAGAEEIDRWLARHKTIVETMANTPTLQSMDWEQISPYWRREEARISDFWDSGIFYPDGTSVKTRVGRSLKNASDRDYFQRAIAGETYISDPVTSRQTGIDLVVIAAPIRVETDGRETIAGIATSSISNERIGEVLGQLQYGKGSYALALNSKGQPIFHRDRTAIGTVDRPTQSWLTLTTPSLQQLARRMVRREKGIKRNRLYGKEVYFAYLPLAEADWSIALIIPRQNIDGKLRPLDYTFASVVALASALIAVLFRVQTLEQSQLQDALQEREKINDRLRQSEKQNRTILSAIPDLLFRVSAEGNYLGYVRAPGVSDALPSAIDPVGRSLSELLPPEIAERRLQAVREALATGNVQVYEQKTTGYWRDEYREIRVVPHTDTEVLFMVRDISDRKVTELALKDAEARYRDIHDNAIEGIFQSTPQGRYLTLNPALARMYGFETPAEAIAHYHNIREQLYVDPACYDEFHRRLELNGSIALFESEIYRRNGSRIWISETARLVRDAEGRILYYEGFVSNISDRKVAEDALYQRNRELAAAIQELELAQEELIHSEKMAALGQLIAGIAHEINTPMGAIRATASNLTAAIESALGQLPELYRTLDRDRLADFNLLLETARQQPERLSSREERAARRALCAELEAREIANASEAARQLVAMRITRADDSVWAILADPQCDRLLATAVDIDLLRSSCADISLAVERASKIAFALKNYARPGESGDMTYACIIEGIETVLTIYRHALKPGIEVVKEYDTIPKIWCNPDALNQVWTNLVHNAIQAMEGQGTLAIKLAREGDRVLASFTDSGSGIPAEVKAKIFEPFFTTKPLGEGSGLGLSIVRRIVDRHAGTISVESQPGCTTFYISLPIARPDLSE